MTDKAIDYSEDSGLGRGILNGLLLVLPFWATVTWLIF